MGLGEHAVPKEYNLFDHNRFEILHIEGNQGKKGHPAFILTVFDSERGKKILMSAGKNEYGTLGQGSGDNKYL